MGPQPSEGDGVVEEPTLLLADAVAGGENVPDVGMEFCEGPRLAEQVGGVEGGCLSRDRRLALDAGDEGDGAGGGGMYRESPLDGRSGTTRSGHSRAGRVSCWRTCLLNDCACSSLLGACRRPKEVSGGGRRARG